jgi:ureidoglycolate hydrolase
MHLIQVQQLSEEAFRRYGSYQDLTNSKQMALRTITGDGKGDGGFYADLLWLDFDRSKNNPSVSVCHIKKSEKNIVKFLEYHQTTCEGLFPFDDDVIIFVGAPGAGSLKTDHLEAFYIPKGTFVKINPLVVHGTQFPVHRDEAHLICLLPGRTFMNDKVARTITSEDEMAVLIYQPV